MLADLESDRVERKESAATSDQLSVAICGFANDMPGYGEPGVLFGVSDKGAVLGQPITDNTAVLLPALLPADVLAENERSTEQRLAARRLTSQDSIPTAAGVLALGVDPRPTGQTSRLPFSTRRKSSNCGTAPNLLDLVCDPPICR